MTTHRTAVFAGLAAALVLAPSAARAQNDDAASLLRSGVALRREHRNAEALDVFTRALALSPTARVRAQVALAEQALGRWVEAERDLDASIASADDPWIAKNRPELQQARALIQERLAWLTVHASVPSAEAELDGRVIPCGVETRVVAGSSVLKVRALGYVVEERNVTLEPARHVEQTIALTPIAPSVAPTRPAVAPEVPVAPATAPAPAAISPNTPRLAREKVTPAQSPVGPIALVVSGGLGLVVGTYFGIRALDLKNEERDACVGGCNSSAQADWMSAQWSASVSTVAFGAGLALASAGGVWWLVLNRDAGKSFHAMHVAPVLGAVTGVVVGSDL